MQDLLSGENVLIKLILLSYSSATYNKIESIDGDTFVEMRRLANLILDYNNITRIEAKTFKDMQSIELL